MRWSLDARLLRLPFSAASFRSLHKLDRMSGGTLGFILE